MKLKLWKRKTIQIDPPLERSVTVGEKNIPYTLSISKRARYIRLTIYREGRLRVTVPRMVNIHKVDNLIREKSEWILSKMKYYSTLPPVIAHSDTKREYQEHKEVALLLTQSALTKYNQYYNFTYKKIHIKNQKTLWGSCSRQGTLNFNYKIALLPEALRDYVIVHELCHLQEFNHSKRFWDLVAKTVPDHTKIRKELKATGLRSK